MYTIIIVSAFFINTATGTPHTVQTNASYISKDACRLAADKLTQGSNLKHICVPKVLPQI